LGHRFSHHFEVFIKMNVFDSRNNQSGVNQLSTATSPSIAPPSSLDAIDPELLKTYGRSSHNSTHFSLFPKVKSDTLNSGLNALSRVAANTVVFIDPSVTDFQELAAGVNSGAEVIILNPKADGIQQISNALSKRKNVESVHIVSHGVAGGIQIGNTKVDDRNIERYSKQLGRWASRLTPDADIVLYGCNVAANEAGMNFVRKFSQLTQADVAASTDLTGNASQGGNWEMEFKTGNIESPLAFQAKALAFYNGTMVAGDGLKGEYFDNRDFTNLKLTRIDPTVNFNWSKGSPNASIGVDTFSVRWSGQVEAKYSETYTFFTTTDDGVRLSVNGQQIINRFIDQAATEVSGAIALEAGKKYDIILEYYENSGQALSRLSWSSLTQGKEIIPQAQLFSTSSTIDLPPSALLNATNLNTAGGNTYTLGIIYSDNTAVDLATLDSQDVRVTGPNNFSQLATLVSVDTNSNGTPRTATYSINAPGGTWDVEDNGGYTFALQANQVSDTSGNFASAATVGSIQVNIISPLTPTPTTGTGLKAEYFDNRDFTNLKLTRTDATVNFNWGKGSPDASIASDTFSVRWTGQVQAKYSETYTFFTTTDDGVRLLVNGQQIINRFIDQAATEVSGAIALEAGKKYDITLEYYENSGQALSRLSWSSLTQTKEIIPQAQLYLPFSGEPSIPSLTLGVVPSLVRESDGSVSVTVQRSGTDLSGISTIKYTTTGETATAGIDYIETAGTLAFAPGETSKTINIPILDDTLPEGIETFTFVIDQPEGANLGTQRTGRISIEDNDRSDLIFSQPTVNEGDGIARVTVTRGNGLGTASVDYTTADGTAKFGSDYLALSGTLNFADGELSKTISISIINDTVAESSEQLTLHFSNAVGVGLAIQDQAVITINDNDSGTVVRETVVSGLVQPAAFDWTPNGDWNGDGTLDGNRMFVAQKDGIVRVVDKGNLLPTPFINISSQVNNVRDRGLLGIAVHPDFTNNPYVYLLFTYDPPEAYSNINPNTNLDDPDGSGNRPSRLIRVTADPTTNYTTAIAGSEVVLLGKNSTWQNTSRPDGNSTNVNSNNTLNFAPSGILNQNGTLFANTQDYLNNLNNITNVQDYLASDSESHSIGAVRFGTDGSLFVSIGDGTSYNRVDPRSIRVQDINNLSGKILRIDPIHGKGLATNPFYNGDPDSNASKVYDLGLRNPFRFTINKQTNIPFIGDVGWKTWEEVNTGRGVNFGWPYYEGGNGTSVQQPEYANLQPAIDFYASGAPVAAPVYGYTHSASNAIVMGDFYTGNTLPSIYQGSLFIADVSQGTIDTLKLNNQGQVVSVSRFDSGIAAPVQITTGPDGNLYYASLASGLIGRWKTA
jgi:glucose/arabinose dehydrogenase